METADLHFHSSHSDGRDSVDVLIRHIRRAVDTGLRLAVLTDHDDIQGSLEFCQKTSDLWPQLLACELSCMLRGEGRSEQEVHFLVYGIREDDEVMRAYFARFKESRRERFIRICEKMIEAGYAIPLDKLLEKHGGMLGRPHIADALIDLGVVKDRGDAFMRFLNNASPFYVKKWAVPLEEAVQHCLRMGYLTSIAHPGQYKFQEKELRYFRSIGVHAIEAWHPRHSEEQIQRYQRWAKELGFEITGGSDYHDARMDLQGGNPSLGRTAYPFALANQFFSSWVSR